RYRHDSQAHRARADDRSGDGSDQSCGRGLRSSEGVREEEGRESADGTVILREEELQSPRSVRDDKSKNGECLKPTPLLLTNIGQLLTLRSAQSDPRRGSSLSELDIIENAAVLCLAGKIVSVGTAKDALRDPWLKKTRKKVTEI